MGDKGERGSALCLRARLLPLGVQIVAGPTRTTTARAGRHLGRRLRPGRPGTRARNGPMPDLDRSNRRRRVDACGKHCGRGLHCASYRRTDYTRYHSRLIFPVARREGSSVGRRRRSLVALSVGSSARSEGRGDGRPTPAPPPAEGPHPCLPHTTFLLRVNFGCSRERRHAPSPHANAVSRAPPAPVGYDP